jgi:hypothetical protein
VKWPSLRSHLLQPHCCAGAVFEFGIPATTERAAAGAEGQGGRERSERLSAQDAENYRQFMANQHKLQEKLSESRARPRAVHEDTAHPAAENALLGQWRLDRTKKKPANALRRSTQRFRSRRARWCSATAFGLQTESAVWHRCGIGESKLTDVDYRGNEGVIGVIPKSGKLFVFKIVGPDRVQELTSTRIGADPARSSVSVRALGAAVCRRLPPRPPIRQLPAGRPLLQGAHPPRRPPKWPPRPRRNLRCRAHHRRSAATRCSTSSVSSVPTRCGRCPTFLQGACDRRQGAEHEQPTHRPARQRVRRPASESDALRLRRE